MGHLHTDSECWHSLQMRSINGSWTYSTFKMKILARFSNTDGFLDSMSTKSNTERWLPLSSEDIFSISLRRRTSQSFTSVSKSEMRLAFFKSCSAMLVLYSPSICFPSGSSKLQNWRRAFSSGERDEMFDRMPLSFTTQFHKSWFCSIFGWLSLDRLGVSSSALGCSSTDIFHSTSSRFSLSITSLNSLRPMQQSAATRSSNTDSVFKRMVISVMPGSVVFCSVHNSELSFNRYSITK